MQSIRGAIRSAVLAFGVAATMLGPAPARRLPGTSPDRAPSRSTGSTRVPARDPEDETPRTDIEPELRRLVADQLGVDSAELVPEVSLVDDLAADSLDLLELAIVVESRFGITLTPRWLDEVRSYRDLLDFVMASVEGRRARERVLTPGLTVTTRLVPAGASEATLERADALSLYVIETIGEDALYAGRGAHLEVTLPARAGTADVASVRDALARLGRHGIAVSVRRDAPTSAVIPPPPGAPSVRGVLT